MDLTDFAKFAKDVAEYYGRKNLVTPRQVELWFDQVGDIPAVALDWIKARMFADQDGMPVNFPKYVRLAWSAWRDAHPEHVAYEPGIECHAPGCEDGWIFLVRGDGSRCVVACDRCAVTRKITTPGAFMLGNLADMIRRGFKPREATTR